MIINDFSKEEHLNKNLRSSIIRLPALLVAYDTLDSDSGGEGSGNRSSCSKVSHGFSQPFQANSGAVLLLGRVIAEAFSHQCPAAASRMRSHFTSCGIRGGQSGIESGFFRVPRFPLPIFIPPTGSHS
jgi:hypothetical protein